jgi:galactoside O-acetyltransferase
MTTYNADFLDAEALARLPLAACGEHVLIDSSARLIGVENISIGNHVRIDAGTIIIATGSVRIDNYVHVAANCYLEGRGGIHLHDFVNISSYVSLHSVSDDFSGHSLTNPMTPEALKQLAIGAIVFERHAAIGVKGTVLPGVTVGEGAVIGGHSLARKSLAPWTIHAGVPARFLRDRSRDVLALEAEMLRAEAERG